MLEAIQQKLVSMSPSDDFEWPAIEPDGSPKPTSSKKSPGRPAMLFGDSDLDSDDNDDDTYNKAVVAYWKSLQKRYQAKLLDEEALRASQTRSLPANWTIVHIALAEDKSTLLLSRQECGDTSEDPLLFCVPLNGRRDNGAGDEEEHLSFEDAMAEFNEIIRLSNENTKAAVHVRPDDEEARASWWKDRNALDVRLKELLENIEFCWLGAFKVRIFLTMTGTSVTNSSLDHPEFATEPHARAAVRLAYTTRQGLSTQSPDQGEKAESACWS